MFNQKPPLGVQLIPGHPMANGLVGCWIMNEGGGNTIYDLSGNGADGVLDSGITWETIKNGSTIYCGTTANNYLVTLSGSNIINLPATKNLSVVVGFKPNSAAAAAAVIAWGGTDDLLIYPNDNGIGSGGLRVFWRNVVGTTLNYDGVDLTNVYTQTVFTARVNDIRGYQDGILVDSRVETLSGVGPFNSLRFGGWVDSAQPFGGHIGYIYIYNRALSASKVQSLYMNPYQMFEPDPIWQYVAYGAAAAGGLSIPLMGGLVNDGGLTFGRLSR